MDNVKTPETEAVFQEANGNPAGVAMMALHARKLETQRDELRAVCDAFQVALEQIARGDTDRGTQLRNIARAALTTTKAWREQDEIDMPFSGSMERKV